MKKILFYIITIILFSCSDDNTSGSKWSWQPIINEEQTLLGFPVDNDDSDDYIIQRYEYTISYNTNLNAANWVSWYSNADTYGTVDRFEGEFMPDPALPPWEFRAVHSSYSNTGFDRGHIVPSMDRTNTAESNKNTFYTTNIYPMYPNFNRDLWLGLELFCAEQCLDSGKYLSIVSGGIFNSDWRINSGRIAVPDSLWKVIVVLDDYMNSSEVDTNVVVISVIMPHKENYNDYDWRNYTTSVDEIERLTGYDLLDSLDNSVEEILESRIYQ